MFPTQSTVQQGHQPEVEENTENDASETGYQCLKKIQIPLQNAHSFYLQMKS
ncbi:Unknown protein sequence [Pseudomonas syringae pv. maculicola str. M6]|nr:Unknown protein sequence [Pseudomonas syringae pv. maculicola str. M6]